MLGLGLAFLLPAGLVGASSARADQGDLLRRLDGEGRRHILVDFAASWCAPCRLSLPRLEELSGRYPGIDFVVVSVDDTEAGRNELVESLGLTLPVIWDEAYRLAERLEPPAMPATFLIDPQGRVLYSHEGYSQEVWDEMLRHLDQIAVKP